MASKSEMEAEHKRDSKQWARRVVLAMQAYNKAKNGGNDYIFVRASAFGDLQRLAREKENLGYDIDDIDPFEVSGFSEEDREMMVELCEKIREANENER